MDDEFEYMDTRGRKKHDTAYRRRPDVCTHSPPRGTQYTPKYTTRPLYSQYTSDRDSVQEAREARGAKHLLREPEEAPPQGFGYDDYDSDDNLILAKTKEYIGRRKERTYRHETWEDYNTRMDAEEKEAARVRRRDGGAAADWRFEQEYLSRHPQRPRPPSAPDGELYKVLGVTRNSTPEEIRHAYRRQAFLTHPDKVPDHPQFNTVRRAGVVLRDADHKRHYDKYGDSDTAWLRMMKGVDVNRFILPL